MGQAHRLAGFVLVAAGVALAAQNQQPTFRARTDAVTLDVTVLDRSGRTVSDLTADDFEVIEQGTPQKIEAFSLVDMATRPPMSSNLYHEVRTLSSQAQELARPESRIFVIFLNDYHVRQADQWQVRNQVGDVVRGLDPRDLVAIMYPLTPTSALSFSRDHDADARLVETFEGRQGLYTFPKGPIEEEQIRRTGGQPGAMEAIRRDVVRTALQGLCTYLGSIREGRKSVLFVSDWAPGGISGFAFDDFRRIQREAAQSNTAIHTYDPTGLTGRPNQWLQTLAEQTGGRATVNTNNGRAGMQRMVSESEAYYLIGYTSTENPRDGKFHEVKVKVKRPGVQLRAKPGYWAYDAEAIARASAPPPPPVDPAVNAALEAAEAFEAANAMVVWAGVDRDDGGATIVNVVWEATDAQSPIDHADVVVASPATSFRGRGQHGVRFPADPGTLSIRVSAQDADASPVDTTSVTLTVPAPAAVQLATPAFYRGRTARLINAPDARPTASREFTKLDQVAVRLHGWTAGEKAPVFTARLLNDHGEPLDALATQPGAPGFATVPVPIGALGLGRYVLEVTATDGTTSARAFAAFRVK